MSYRNHHRRPEHIPTFRTQEHHAPYVPPHRPNQEFRQSRETRAVLTLNSLVSTPQDILATEYQLHMPQPAPLVGVPSKENINKYCDYHNEKGHSTNDCFHLKKQLDIALESGTLNHLVKDKRKTTMTYEKWMNIPITFSSVLAQDLLEEALVVEGEIEGYLIWMIHVDEGASVEIMGTCQTVRKNKADVCFGGSGLCRWAIMKFTIIPVPSSYNIILGRPSLKQLRAISSTIHGMMKFPTPWGIATLESQMPIIFECRGEGKKQAVERPEETKLQEKVSLTEQVLVNHAYPKKLVVIGKGLSPEGSTQLKNLLKKNKDIFAWEPADMTEISNPVLVKKVDGSWRMCIDFKNINAACPKDYYPLPEIDSKIESDMGFLLKCFLDAYKGYHQVQMVEEDKERLPSTWTRKGRKRFPITQKDNPGPAGPYNSTFEGNFVHIPGGIERSSQCSIAGGKERKAISGTLYEVSSVKGSDAGLVLISLTKTKYTYALRLNFESTNNHAEYESLLAGLRISKKTGVQSLSVNVDSKFVASQINGNYEACPLQANYVIREIYMGACNMHLKARSVVIKAIRQGYYWPTMHQDTREEIRKCDSCQIHSLIPKLPKTLMTSIMAPCPFFQWGMDVLVPLSEALGKINMAIAHPQANGLVIRANRSLMEGIKTRLGLTFGSEAVIPAEISMPTHRTMMVTEERGNEEEIRLNLGLLTERR
ncbi:reverse transcriptase domain-containing protein [Tanacetum coccineum]